MLTLSLKRKTIPKVAVMATGLAAAFLVVTVQAAPAEAHVGYTQTCDGCHSAGGSVKATPSSATPAPGAAYTVALAFTGGSSPSGFWISGNGVNVTGSSSTSASMTAPTAAGTYTYTVWVRSGVVASSTYSITVAPVATTPPVTTTTAPPVTTTTPPVTTTTAPPVTTTTAPPVTTTTAPPVTTTTAPPVTTTTAPPVTTTTPPVTTTTAPPVTTTTAPPVTTTTAPPVTTTTPPVTTATARITRMSPDEGYAGMKVTIKGSGFGTPGAVTFGTVNAKVSSWTGTSIVVRVPEQPRVMVLSGSKHSEPVWYRHDQEVRVTVTPKAAAASKSVEFEMKATSRHHR